MKRAVVILAGGAGTRLQPLSSEENPKQFLTLFEGQSLLQKTWHRARRLAGSGAVFVSTGTRYRDKCLAQLPDLEPENLLLEPARRNTAPAVALCTYQLEARLGDCVIAFLPSDHFIGDEAEFARVFERAFAFASTHDNIVAIGIEPTEPSTEFGYHDLGEEVAPGVIRMRRFIEKPPREKAEEFLRAGNYAWNGGMYVWRPAVFRTEVQGIAPELAHVTVANYDRMPSISIDYALMEHSRRLVTVRGNFGWSDVGSFEALERVGVKVPR